MLPSYNCEDHQGHNLYYISGKLHTTDNAKMKVFFVGDCKGFSHFTQVIWGHWVLGQDSDTIFDSLFSQKIFFDALTRTTRNQ